MPFCQAESQATFDHQPPREVALFDVTEYTGTILTDLFGEHGQFADVEHFWEFQNAAIAKEVETYKADGWKEVILGERGRHFPTYCHVHHPKEQGGSSRGL